jgi:hypothetical protein
MRRQESLDEDREEASFVYDLASFPCCCIILYSSQLSSLDHRVLYTAIQCRSGQRSTGLRNTRYHLLLKDTLPIVRHVRADRDLARGSRRRSRDRQLSPRVRELLEALQDQVLRLECVLQWQVMLSVPRARYLIPFFVCFQSRKTLLRKPEIRRPQVKAVNRSHQHTIRVFRHPKNDPGLRHRDT